MAALGCFNIGQLHFNVGIGTTSPEAKLDIVGNLQFEGSTQDTNETLFSITDPTADRTWTIGDVSADFTHTTEDYVLTYNATTRTWSGEAATGGANTALSNLASVAINTSLISDTDSTDDLGSSTKYWANTYTDQLYTTGNVGPIR